MTRQRKQHSQEIDQDLQRYKREFESTHRLLLLGEETSDAFHTQTYVCTYVCTYIRKYVRACVIFILSTCLLLRLKAGYGLIECVASVCQLLHIGWMQLRFLCSAVIVLCVDCYTCILHPPNSTQLGPNLIAFALSEMTVHMLRLCWIVHTYIAFRWREMGGGAALP